MNRSRTRSVANGVRALFAVGMFGAFFMGALYFQHVLGYSAIVTGLAFLPLNLTIGVFSLGITARIMARIGLKATFVPGLVLVAGHHFTKDYRAARSLIGLVPQELTTDAFESVLATVSFSRLLFGKPPNPARSNQPWRYAAKNPG